MRSEGTARGLRCVVTDPTRAIAIMSARDGATAVRITNSIAAALLLAGDTSACPNRLGSILDWLMQDIRSIMHGELLQSSAAEVRWRLLGAVLTAAGGAVSEGGGAHRTSVIPAGLRARFSQNGRALLQAAAAIMNQRSGADGPEEALLVEETCRTVRRLLISESSWFRPGPEATAEYAATLCASAAGALNALRALAPTDRGDGGGGDAAGDSGVVTAGADVTAATITAAVAAGAAAGDSSQHVCVQLLVAANDALNSLVQLQDQTQPRRLLQLFIGTLLRPALELRVACVAIVDGPRTSERGTTAAAPPLVQMARATIDAVESGMRVLMMHPGAPPAPSRAQPMRSHAHSPCALTRTAHAHSRAQPMRTAHHALYRDALRRSHPRIRRHAPPVGDRRAAATTAGASSQRLQGQPGRWRAEAPAG